ncbi:nucleotide-binding domain-containing protein [Clavulina sp. PMI_390]|nr:nucleotide-binding domain-containing protein [Clavulina sp. PMI_390]
MASIVVLGAGVVGLTTALKIQETYPNAEVTVVAELFPGDENIRSTKYTSIWAGAHHVSLATDERQNTMDRETFAKMWEMSAPGSETEHCFLRLPQTEWYAEDKGETNCLSVMPDYRVIEAHELQPNTVSGVSFTTLTIDSPVYLDYLFKQFTSKGGRFVRSSVQHISQVIDGAYSSIFGTIPSAVVVCLGLGARSMGGIEDKDVYPIRGQTVLINAPWVIIGGIKDDDDWYPHPRPEVTEDILTRGLALCPELISPETTFSTSPAPTIADLKPQILEENCGLRPARKGGIRLEVELVKSTARKDLPSKEVPVVYNYGHGGYGYQSSWGSATMALDLLKSKLPVA